MRLIYFILSLLIFSSCKTTQFNKLETKQALNQLMNQWHLDATNSNIEAYFDKIAHNGIYIGTDASEIWSKKEFKKFSKPYFDKKQTWDFKTQKRNIYFSNNKEIAWFDELLTTWMGTCRGSGILELENNKWKLKHYVLSVTIPNDEIKKVIKIKINNTKM